MNYAILRVKKRHMPAVSAMAKHALREAAVPNASPDKAKDNTVIGPKTAAEVVALIKSKLPENRRKDAVPCIELFVGASPEAMQKMSRKQQDAYFKAALGWISERFGGSSNIASAVIHRDETTPHLQLLLVPLLDGKLNAKALVGNRKAMQDMQTDFAKMAEPFGLRRGEKASGAKHTSIRQFYGAIEALGGPDRLPPRVAMPKPLQEPGMFSGRAEKAAFKKREEDREAARLANIKRQAEIEQLAKITVAVHGRGRRRVVDAAAEVKEAQAQAGQAKEQADQAARLVQKAREEFNQLDARKGQIEGELVTLMRRRDVVAKQLDNLEQPAARPVQRPR